MQKLWLDAPPAAAPAVNALGHLLHLSGLLGHLSMAPVPAPVPKASRFDVICWCREWHAHSACCSACSGSAGGFAGPHEHSHPSTCTCARSAEATPTAAAASDDAWRLPGCLGQHAAGLPAHAPALAERLCCSNCQQPAGEMVHGSRCLLTAGPACCPPAAYRLVSRHAMARLAGAACS